MRARFSVLIAICVVWLSACQSTTPPPLRKTAPEAPPMRLYDLENRLNVSDGQTERCSDPVLRSRSIETFLDDNKKKFYVGVVELSDDGHVSNLFQEEQVVKRLRQVALGGDTVTVKNSKGAVVVTFVHGWHHRAKVCDPNLACFRRVLQALSEGQDLPVFGIYIGWRGESVHKGSVFTFYGRKRTAHTIGGIGGRELLQELDETYRELNHEIEEKTGKKHVVTMVTAGHSFGGALVYSAVEAALVREIPNPDPNKKGSVHVVGKPPLTCGSQTIRPIRPGIGDLVVLVNPAFEALRYETFAEDLKISTPYPSNQLPVLLTVASEADSAVGVAFPAGRIVYFLAFPWRYQGSSDVIGQGHFEPQITHDLILADDSGKEIHPGPAPTVTTTPADEDTIKRCDLDIKNDHDTATCACEYPVPPSLAGALSTTPGSLRMSLAGGAVSITPDEKVVLKARSNDWDPHAPFIVARTVKDIISAHSDIYTPRFVTFLVSYIRAFLVQSAINQRKGGSDDPCPAMTAAGGR